MVASMSGKPLPTKLAGGLPRPNARGAFAKNVIVVTSGKGGVGKSTVAVNLASVLAQRDFAVGVLDADVYGPSVPRLLQVDGERLRWNEQDRIVPSENFGLKVMSVGLTTPTGDTPLIWRSAVATSALIQLLDDVEWGPLDFLVVDMPPGTGDTQLTMAQELSITAAVVVTTPQPVATDDVRRAIRMLKDVKAPIGGVVENMSGFLVPGTTTRLPIFGEGGGQRLADEYGLKLLGQIPLDMAIREASDAGTPLAAVGTPEQKKPFEDVVDALFKAIEFRVDRKSGA